MKQRLLFLVILLLVSVFSVHAQDSTTPADEPSCDSATQSFELGLHEWTFEIDGHTRRFWLYVPESYDPTTPTPLVMSFHGFGSNPVQQYSYSAWDKLADAHGFVVAYPQGTGFPARWNSGPLSFGDSTSEDVAYVDKLLDTLEENLCIDSARVYTNGLSNGGGMSYRLACELSDRITAMGGVAGYYTLETCEPTRPVPVIAFHGDRDSIVPIDGVGDVPAIADWVAGWVERNECQTTEALEPVGTVSGTRYTDCADDVSVVYYVVGGGGHTWPGEGEQPEFISGMVNRDISASTLMWEFFSQYTLPR